MHRHARFTPQHHGAPLRGLSIRLATVEDSLAISAIELADGLPDSEPLIRAELTSIAQGNLLRQSWVAEHQGGVLAYGRCSLRGAPEPPCALPPGWYLSGLRVHPTCRRRGVGRALVQARLHWVFARAARCYYYTHPRNRSSVALHAPFGFVELDPAVPTGRSDGPSRLFVLDRA